MAITNSTNQPGGGSIGQGQLSPGSFQDVYGFDNDDNTSLQAIYDREVRIYGNRSLAGFLRATGSEKGINSKRIQWGEQTRKHIYYNRVRRTNAAGEDFTINENDATVSGTTTRLANHSVRVGDKVLVGDASRTYLAVVSNKDATTGVVTLRSARAISSGDAGFASLGSGTTNLSILVVGNDSGKGSNSPTETIQPTFTRHTNDMVVLRKHYSINGSDANQIGWLQGVTESGEQTHYWFMKGKAEERERFEDYTEIQLLEEEVSATGSPAATAVTNELGARSGTEGLWSALRDRGNVTTGTFAETTASGARTQFDVLVRQFDKEGNIEENMLFLNRVESLAIDDNLSLQNSYGTGGSSYGVFSNSKDMAINLGFTGWRRGSYDFYKTDWKYLNQVDGRGSFAGVEGVSVPVGMKSTYDDFGGSMKDPFLAVNYLEGPGGSRKMKSWVTGSVGALTDDEDAMKVHFLSERLLKVCGANNFFLFT